MKKHEHYIYSFIFSAVLAVCISFSSAANVFAAQDEKNNSISKGTTAFIMIAVFIATAVCTAFITFRIKKKNISRSAGSSSKEEEDK